MVDSEEVSFGGRMAAFFRRLFHKNGETVREALEEIIEEREEEDEPIAADERRLLTNALKLSQLTLKDVMVPRSDIDALDSESTFEDVVAALIRSGHSRIPVYRNTLDDVIGIVHIKDVLEFMTLTPKPSKSDLHKLFHPPLFVVPSMRALDLLVKMRVTQRHLALVIDEFGGVDGLVTIEDIIEQIVGEIDDEHDIVEGPKLMPRPDGSVLADARATIEEFESWAGAVLQEDEREDIDTVGGLVGALAGRVPARGEIIRHPQGIEFEILDADPRRIKRVRIRKHKVVNQDSNDSLAASA
ncbi:MAG: hemolysin family protein [Dongiaceae bacterium]